jgi:hypothetical protein
MSVSLKKEVMVKLLTVGWPAQLDAPPDGGVADVWLEVGLDLARGSPNARTRNRRNEARLLLEAFADSDHGRDYRRDRGSGQTTGRRHRGCAGRSIKGL